MAGKAVKASPPSPPTAAKGARRPRRTLLSTVLILTPLLLLVVDLLAFPLFLDPQETWPLEPWPAKRRADVSIFGPSKKTVSVSALLVQRALPVGAFKSYRVYLSLDDLASPRGLEDLAGTGNAALAISHFVDPETEESATGALGRTVLDRLAETSPNDHAVLWDTLERMHRSSPGEVVELSLHVPDKQFRKFPFDHLFIAVLDENVSAEILSKALVNLFRKVERRQVSRLVLPRLGYRWDSGNRSFASYFDAVFAAVQPAERPRDLYLSLYSQWPTFILEEAVSSLNAAPPAERDPESETRLPYRRDLRLALLLLPICLFVCSLHVPITLKSFVLIGTGLVGSLLGSKELLSFSTQGLDETWQFGAQAIVWLLLALLFPVVVLWNPADLFKKSAGAPR